ncbi:MAG: dihydroneopterin aldolase [Hahellaceae bacterium]|nr:dihydroneopterin aldolase [Hahellaceae bacterium]MCP5168490.1 dihydroneopterin aldolase [Hahellaceae bacterium]
MDQVFIEGLEVETLIGVYDWERTIRQRVIFDLEMDYDCRVAAEGDALDKALDYSAVAEMVRSITDVASYQLLETLAEEVASALLANFAISRIQLRLSKPGAVPAARNVGIKIVRMSEK